MWRGSGGVKTGTASPNAPLQAISGNGSIAEGVGDAITCTDLDDALREVNRFRSALAELHVENATLRKRASQADSQAELIEALREDNIRLREEGRGLREEVFLLRRSATADWYDGPPVPPLARGESEVDVSEGGGVSDDEYESDKENGPPGGPPEARRGARPTQLTEEMSSRVFRVLSERPVSPEGLSEASDGSADDEAEVDEDATDVSDVDEGARQYAHAEVLNAEGHDVSLGYNPARYCADGRSDSCSSLARTALQNSPVSENSRADSSTPSSSCPHIGARDEQAS